MAQPTIYADIDCDGQVEVKVNNDTGYACTIITSTGINESIPSTGTDVYRNYNLTSSDWVKVVAAQDATIAANKLTGTIKFITSVTTTTAAPTTTTTTTPAGGLTGFFECQDPRLYNIAYENDAGNGIIFSNRNWPGASAAKIGFTATSAATVAVYVKNDDGSDSATIVYNNADDVTVAAGTSECKVYNLAIGDTLSVKKASGSFSPDTVSGYISSLNNTCPGTALTKYPLRGSEDINSPNTVAAYDFTNYRIVTLLNTDSTASGNVPPDMFAGWLYSADLTTYTIYINSTDNITMVYCPDSADRATTTTYSSTSWNAGIAMSSIPGMISSDLVFTFKIASGNKNYEIKII